MAGDMILRAEFLAVRSWRLFVKSTVKSVVAWAIPATMTRPGSKGDIEILLIAVSSTGVACAAQPANLWGTSSSALGSCQRCCRGHRLNAYGDHDPADIRQRLIAK